MGVGFEKHRYQPFLLRVSTSQQGLQMSYVMNSETGAAVIAAG